MRKNFRLASTFFLASTVIISSIAPMFAQNYNYRSTYTPTYNQSYTTQPSYSTPTTYPAYNQNYNQGYQQVQNYLPPLQGRVVTVPAGTSISATTTNALSSEFLNTGDTVTVGLGSDFYYNGVLVAPGGSSVEGNVVLAEKAGLTGKNGKLKIRFTNILTPNGQRIPISGKIMTQDGTGLLVGGTGTGRMVNVAKNTAVGAGSGALFGTVIGAITGRTGRGAWSGTAVGAGLGLGKSVIDKGNDATIPAGSRIDVVLEQSATVNPSQGYSY